MHPASTPAFNMNRGAALVFVVFAVFLVAAISVSLLSDQFKQIRQLEHSRAFSQILQYAHGAEAWAIEVLKRDLAESKIDHLTEAWALPLTPTKVDSRGNQLSAQITDITSLFDINRLVKEGKADEKSVKQFQTLLSLLDIDAGLADKWADWMDKDQETRASGAESTYYTLLQPAYRAPDQHVRHIDESLYIDGVEVEALRQLNKYVTSLPEPSQVNVNTLSAEMMTAYIPGLDLSTAENLVQQRESKHWQSPDEFVNQLIDNSGTTDEDAGYQINMQDLSVISKFFRVTATVEYDGSILVMHSDIYRDPDGGMQVYQRDMSFLQ